jgi:heterodisulfide reductase subunit B
MADEQIIYYPGCTLHTWAASLSETAVESFSELGIQFKEMDQWTCCQASYPLAEDNMMGLVSAGRILAQAKQQGDTLTTLCSFCFNVLRRTNLRIRTDDLARQKVNAFLEEDYKGDLPILHPLEILRDRVGFDSLKARIKRPLAGLKVASYYGCQMIRPPEEMKFDDPEDPRVLDDMLASLGADVVDFPLKVECCGSYLSIKGPDHVLERIRIILNNAQKNGAEALVLSCPLCYYNLEHKQGELLKKYPDMKKMPIFYFTELLGIALGLDVHDFKMHDIDPLPLLRSKGLDRPKKIPETEVEA